MNGYNVVIDLETSQKYALFQAAEFGDINLVRYLLDKGLDIDGQDEEGDTLLHHSAKWGHSKLVTYLLRRQASAVIMNKKGRTALLEAYANNNVDIVRKITRNVVERNSIKLLGHSFQYKKNNHEEKVKLNNFINECKKQIRENYLNRSILIRLMARHNERAKALIQALIRCASMKEARGLIKNQCDLFEKGEATSLIPSSLLASRWSEKIKNKPKNVIKSSFYKILNTMPRQKLPAVLQQSHRQINITP